MPKLSKEIREYMADLGRRSKGGGRRRIPYEQLTDKQKARRARYERELELKAERELEKTRKENAK